MTYEQRVKQVFDQAVADFSTFWTIYNGDPVYLRELGFGRTAPGAWKNAWKRYQERKALVEQLWTSP